MMTRTRKIVANEYKVYLGKHFINAGLKTLASALLFFIVFYGGTFLVFPSHSPGTSLIHFLVIGATAALIMLGLLGILAGKWELDHAQHELGVSDFPEE